MTHEERVFHHMYETNEGIEQQSKRIAKLEELVLHLHACIEHHEIDETLSCDICPYDNETGDCDFERRMEELEVQP